MVHVDDLQNADLIAPAATSLHSDVSAVLVLRVGPSSGLRSCQLECRSLAFASGGHRQDFASSLATLEVLFA